MRKTQAKSKKVKCDICGKEVYARGLKSHVRLLHELNITDITTKVSIPVATKVKADFSKKPETPVKPTKLLKSGGDITQVKPDLSREKIVYKTVYITETITEYTPYISECDGCKKQLKNVNEIIVQNGELCLYLCPICRKDEKVITKCSKEIFAKGGSLKPGQKKVSNIEKAYLANTENHKKTGIKRIPHYTLHEIEHLKKLGYKP